MDGDIIKKLYLIPTPIGNLDDISERMIKTIKESDILLAEDTRNAQKLLNHLNISKKVLSNHHFNESKNISKITNLLKEEKTIGLMSDRGTPLISDPGSYVVEVAIKYGYELICIPGPTAIIPALVVSGLKTQPFKFIGFLDSKKSKRIKELEELQNEDSTMVFYESPHRLEVSLEDMLKVFGDRKVSITKEISKKYEKTYRSKLSQINEMIHPIKGEYVVVVDGNKEIIDFSSLNYVEHVNLYLNQGMVLMDAIKKVAKERKKSKSYVYKIYHQNGDD